jgi:ribosomal protein L37AE/L43A
VPITDDACSGPCNGRARSAWTAYDEATDQHAADMQAWLKLPGDDRGERPSPPEQPTITVNLGEPTFCGRCARLIHTALAELDDTAALLAAGIDGHRGGGRSGPNGTAAPSHTAIVDSLDDLYSALAQVEDQWREYRGYQPKPRRARDNHARTLTIAWLSGQLDDILLHPGSVEFGMGVLRWQRRLRAMTKSDPADRRSPIRCPRCKERQVTRREDGYYECLCGRLLNQAEHDEEKDRQAVEYDREQQEVGA